MIAMKPDAATLQSEAEEEAEGATLSALPIALEGERAVVRGFRGWAYSAAVVDLDPKPVGKMAYYYKVDRQVAEFYAEAEQSGTLVE